MTNCKLLATLAAGFFVAAVQSASAQVPANLKKAEALKTYRETPTKINDLVHTKLDVRFDYKKRYMYGQEWVTLKPHLYPTDSLRLDAKGMDIKTLAVVKNGKKIPLKFTYDSLALAIHLDKVYRNNETYTLYINYTSKPDQLKIKGSAAINDAKGLYFINPDSTVKDKPVQIWTQGETEASSAWFPTIDKPDQKTTEEITMTVPSKYVTLSNGKLVSQKNNGDGTRTDNWKMDLPHSPYLFMMAIGDFKIYHDKWRDKPVDYYLEPKYAAYAKDIFGYTPEIMEFYSKILGVDYPWNKYAQIVVRDYVSGAMENTTATLHGEQVQSTGRELIDGNPEGEIDIAHELFHQWFGDYVTCESWSNLTVNESFADFSEVLWAEHKHGKDAGDAHNYEELQRYLSDSSAASKPLVRFHYADKEDMFDVVSYQKGGRILNMLRNYLGEEAFFKGLNIYLKTNAFKNGEAQQLRLAFEEASGRDLNWFFNQWYYKPGHPLLQIDYKWDTGSHTQTVYLQQNQTGDVFTLPINVDIYAGGKTERHQVWMRDRADTLTFKVPVKPDLVNVDADKILLAKKNDNKPEDTYWFQYQHAPLFMDRFEAIDFAENQSADNANARKIILAALKDKYFDLRIKAISALKLDNDDVRNAAVPILTNMAQTDEKTQVRAAALGALATLKASGNTNLFKQALNSQSYAVQASALYGLTLIDPASGLTLAKSLEKDSEGDLAAVILNIYTQLGSDAEWPYVYHTYDEIKPQDKVGLVRNYADFIGRLRNPQLVQQSVMQLQKLGLRYKSQGIAPRIITVLESIKTQRSQQNDQASVKVINDAIKPLQ
ncbi:M1 family metallopeptidase [Mucilaginibacter robiniae]|uniref:Aminopeptidase N n=1 Tax=Mucilaginibacter robiniae TaxID=2728022 RepID=A0A7L5DW50_9SPHI|nr:M1 family metallopeptidase [Mucilaginibacter robiniae]QJD95320.1 M1 family metallopeptidase [Mucilaginibacter robiniae]